jgi:transposase
MFSLAAQSAMRSQTAIGAFIRRTKARLRAPVAINAGVPKLAQSFYRMLKFGETYVEPSSVERGQTYYEEKYKEPKSKEPKSGYYAISTDELKS